jgi:hypothetical protein
MKSQCAHSKVRFSDRSDCAALLARFIRVRHLAQRGRSISESNASVLPRDEVMLFTKPIAQVLRTLNPEPFFVGAVADKK